MAANAWNISNLPPQNAKVYSCAIVLGGFTSIDNNGNGYFNSSADRFIQGIKLLTTGKVTHLLITGGNGSLIPGHFREGEWVKTQLKQLKYPDSSILIESASRNTIENAVFSKRLLQKANLPPPYLLVTSAYHMRRAMMIFKKEGYNVISYPGDFSIGGDSLGLTDMIPDAGTLGYWNTYFKEMVGYVVDRFKK